MKFAKSILAATLLAVAVGAGAAEPSSETSGQYIDDATITSKVKSAFVKDPVVNALDVKVETYKGTVQLSGFASSQAEIQRAESTARSVSGVTDVKNDIQLKPASQK